jgi:hypothetical protein
LGGWVVEWVLLKDFNVKPTNHSSTPPPTKKTALLGQFFRGGEGSRTPVQTYSSKVFYMLIDLLFVGREQEDHQPILSLAA